MMGIMPLGVAGLTPATQSARASLDRQQFLELLTTELVNQDPLSPMDSTQFLQQMVALEQVQSNAAMQDSLKAFGNLLQLSVAGGLIGKQAEGITDEGLPVEGTVEKVTIERGEVWIDLGEIQLPFRNVISVAAPPVPEAPPVEPGLGGPDPAA